MELILLLSVLLPIWEVTSFIDTPTAFVSKPGSQAISFSAITYEDSNTLSAAIPKLDPGVYDIILINPSPNNNTF